MLDRFYGLSTDPFRLSPDHTSCFYHKNFSRARDYVVFSIMRREGFAMITGEPGTGKTTLINDLRARFIDADVEVALLVNTQLDVLDLLRMIAIGFGLAAESPYKAILLQQLIDYWGGRMDAGHRALLIVDEAQNLSASALEELRLLTNLERGGKQLLQILLVGQESLRDTIRSPHMRQVHQRIVAAWRLRPLAPTETIGYIRHRLEVAGWRGDPTFAPGVFRTIHEYSQGIPRLINLVCSRLLLRGFSEGSHLLSAEDAALVVRELRDEDLEPPPTAVDFEDDGEPDSMLVDLMPAELLPAERDARQAEETRFRAEWDAKPQADGAATWSRLDQGLYATADRTGQDPARDAERPRQAEPSERAPAPIATPAPAAAEASRPAPKAPSDETAPERAIPDLPAPDAPAPAETKWPTTEAASWHFPIAGPETDASGDGPDAPAPPPPSESPPPRRGGWGKYLVAALAVSGLVGLLMLTLMLRLTDPRQPAPTTSAEDPAPPPTAPPTPPDRAPPSVSQALAVSVPGSPPGPTPDAQAPGADASAVPGGSTPPMSGQQTSERQLSEPRVSEQPMPADADAPPVEPAPAERVARTAPEPSPPSSPDRTAADPEQTSVETGVAPPAKTDEPPMPEPMPAEPIRPETMPPESNSRGDVSPEPADPPSLETGSRDLAETSPVEAGADAPSPAPLATASGAAPTSARGPEPTIEKPPSSPSPALRVRVLFGFDSTRVTSRFAPELDKIADALLKAADNRAEVIGFADHQGNPRYNLDLSRRRAESVAKYLVDLGVSRSRLMVEGRGPQHHDLDEADAPPASEQRMVLVRILPPADG